MDKKTFFFIDDVIWFLRDITRERPASIFDHHFLKVLKTAHDKYGLKVQLNLFYRTDYFYGTDEFTLSDVTDAYKAEFEANSDWLKMSFHAKQEFPDYPNVNADYDDIKGLYTMMKNEVIRFAGENSWGGDSLVTHWLPLSKDACKALADCGAKMVCCTSGDTEEYVDQTDCLPYGHLGRLLQNRKPETKLFFRDSRDVAIEKSICGWNHLTSRLTKPSLISATFTTRRRDSDSRNIAIRELSTSAKPRKRYMRTFLLRLTRSISASSFTSSISIPTILHICPMLRSSSTTRASL